MLGPPVFPDSQVIPEWWVLQYIQIHEIISEWLDFQYFQVQTILEQLTTQFHISKCIDFEFGCESRSSGSFRWIRLVKLVSKKSISAFRRDNFGPNIEFLLKIRRHQQISSLLYPLGGLFGTSASMKVLLNVVLK